MRSDMFKVIVERPRWSSRTARSPKLRFVDDDVKSIGLKRHARHASSSGKGLNENLAPLRRFLRSRRGQRWDAVFSEICAELDTGSTVKMHVRQHLGDLVMLDIGLGRHGELMHDGRVLTIARLERYRYRDLFVDPDDGVLKDLSVLRRRLGGAK